MSHLPWKLKLWSCLTFCTFKTSTVAHSIKPWGTVWTLLRSWQISMPYWLRYTPGDFQQTTGGKIWRRAERRVPFSKAFQLNLGKNKCTSWTFPRRPPGWAIGLAESLASTSYFTTPLELEVRHTCQTATWHQNYTHRYPGSSVTDWLSTFMKVTPLKKPRFKNLLLTLSLSTLKKAVSFFLNYVNLFNTWEILTAYKNRNISLLMTQLGFYKSMYRNKKKKPEGNLCLQEICLQLEK